MSKTAPYTQKFSEKLRSLVDEALEKKGISARSASQAIVGHDSLIRDIRAGTIPRADRALALLEYLDVSPRDLGDLSPLATLMSFAEKAEPYETGTVSGTPNALKEGYLPIPFEPRFASKQGSSDLAFSRRFLEQGGLNPETLFILRAETDHMPQSVPRTSLALIDTSKRDPRDSSMLCAYSETPRQYDFGHVSRSGSHLIISFEVPGMPPAVFDDGALWQRRIIGAVIGVFASPALPQEVDRQLEVLRTTRVVANPPSQTAGRVTRQVKGDRSDSDLIDQHRPVSSAADPSAGKSASETKTPKISSQFASDKQSVKKS